MKRYSFVTFEADDANRRAYEVCRAVASLERVSPLPVLLLGHEACGKTHLLYSIVNRVRAGSAKTGLAYVTAQDFPEQVIALIDDPSPVERAQSAVLLVDQLEQFTELVVQLEAVVRLFLDNHHYVVLASSVHPGRLKNLTEGLREVIENGQIVEFLSIPPATVAEPAHEVLDVESNHDELWAMSEESERGAGKFKAAVEKEAAVGGELEGLEAEGKGRREELGEVEALREAKAAADRETSELRYQVAALEAEWKTAQGKAAKLKAALEVAVSEKTSVENDREELRDQVAALEAEWKTVQGKAARLEAALAEKSSVESELEGLRQRVLVLEAESQASADKAAQIDPLLSEKAALEAQVEHLQEELDAARSEGAVARQEANELVRRAETLLAQVESSRTKLAEAERKHREEIRDLEALIEQQNLARASAEELEEAQAQRDVARAEAEAARADLAKRRQEFTQTRESLETELALAKTESHRATEGRDEAMAKQDELNATLEATQAELQRITEVRDATQAKNDELTGLLERAKAERDDRQAALDETTAAKSALELEAAKLREDLEAQARQVETLRHESAAQADELENRISEVYSAFDLTRQTSRVVGVGLDSVREQLFDTTEALTKLATRLSAANNVTIEGVSPQPYQAPPEPEEPAPLEPDEATPPEPEEPALLEPDEAAHPEPLEVSPADASGPVQANSSGQYPEQDALPDVEATLPEPEE